MVQITSDFAERPEREEYWKSKISRLKVSKQTVTIPDILELICLDSAEFFVVSVADGPFLNS